LEAEIEKREHATRELQEQRVLLKSILENLPGAAYRCYFDEQYTMKYISEKIFDISGYHASEFIENAEKTFASIIHPDDQDMCRSNIQNATLQRTQYEFEFRLIHKNGLAVWVSENGKGIYNNKEELTYLDGIIVDVTRRKEAENDARDSEMRYKDLMDLLPQPVFELNLKGEIVLNNKAGDEFFGSLPSDSNKKQSALDCFVKADIPRIIENFKKLTQGIATEPGEFTAIKKDGSLCPVVN
jgi:PAS domain S-box-containing protein